MTAADTIPETGDKTGGCARLIPSTEKRRYCYNGTMRKRKVRGISRKDTKQKQTGPKRRRKLSPYGWALVAVAVAALAVGIYYYVNQPTALDKLDLTVLQTYDKTEVQKGVQTEFSDSEVYPISDYAYYGETLTLYQNAYDPLTADPTLGKNVVLRNIITGDELTYTFGGGGDLGIQTGVLEEGVYEIYIYDQYTRKRVYFEEPTQSETVDDLRREGQVKEVVLDADADLFSDYDVDLDRNYAFLVVTEQMPRVKTADIIIDPGGNVYNELTYTSDAGQEWNGTTEAQLAMELADLVKARLEAAGLRVAYTREADEVNGYYGDAGRTAAGYSRQAKVFLTLSMTGDDTTSRPWLLTSPFVSGTLPSQIAYDLRQMGIELQSMGVSEVGDDAVTFDALQQNEDWSYNQYSMSPSIRETGGKITYAGQSGLITGNQMYQNAPGMYALDFVFGNSQNEDSMNYYMEHKEQIADGIAQGILDYYGIEVTGDETADQ